MRIIFDWSGYLKLLARISPNLVILGMAGAGNELYYQNMQPDFEQVMRYYFSSFIWPLYPFAVLGIFAAIDLFQALIAMRRQDRRQRSFSRWLGLRPARIYRLALSSDEFSRPT
jgi:hypothetical protein